MYTQRGKLGVSDSRCTLYSYQINECFYRSKIQGLGLYAARDIDKHTMVIEYIGEIIRSQLSDFREKQYEAKVIIFNSYRRFFRS